MALNSYWLILMSYLFWCLLYISSFFYKPGSRFRLNRKATIAELYCRVVTLIHALLATCISLWIVLTCQIWSFASPNTKLQEYTMIFSLGYFLFDFSWCIYHKTEDAFMIFHHLVTITGFTLSLVLGTYGIEVITTLFGTEITNPILQIRWFILNISKEDSSVMTSLTESEPNFISDRNSSENGNSFDPASQNSSSKNEVTKTEAGTYTDTKSFNIKHRNVKSTSNFGDGTGQPSNNNNTFKRKNIMVVDFIFFSMFTIMRVVAGSIFFVVYQISLESDIPGRVGAVLIYTIGLGFWLKMIGYLHKNYWINSGT